MPVILHPTVVTRILNGMGTPRRLIYKSGARPRRSSCPRRRRTASWIRKIQVATRRRQFRHRHDFKEAKIKKVGAILDRLLVRTIRHGHSTPFLRAMNLAGWVHHRTE